MNEQWRPPFCPDRTCTPLIRPLTDSDNRDLSTDYAVFCFGRLAEPIDWTFAGVEHHETLSQCQSSPLKGNIRWLDNEADWGALASTYRIAVEAAHRALATPDRADPLPLQFDNLPGRPIVQPHPDRADSEENDDPA